MTQIALRPYQEEGLTFINEAETRGVRRQLGVAATGLGKTIMFASMTERRGEPTLILAHRDELINQAVDKILQVWPEADIGVVKAERNELGHQVIVASVQTLARRTRREQLPLGHFGLVVVDEAHHVAADSYQNILRHVGVFEPDGPLLVGVTATPGRGDGKGLGDTFQEIVFNYDMLWGIRSGYLSDLRGVRVYLEDADFTKVKVSRGDYDPGEAGEMLQDANAPQEIVQAWHKHAEDRKTIVFTPTVKLAELVAEEFRSDGVPAAMLSAKTPLEERRQILRDLTSGAIKIVANCGVLTEGFDEPSVSCIVMARPTKSQGLYVQCIGRGTRRHPGKTDCLVIDVCGASANHSLVTIPSLFGIKKEEDFEEAAETVTNAIAAQETEERKRGEMRAAEVDLFRQVIESPIAWVTFNVGVNHAYTCGLGSRENGAVMIEPLPHNPEEPSDAPTRYHCFIQWDNGYVPEGDINIRTTTSGEGHRTLITNVDLEMAQGVGEDYVRKNGAAHLTERAAPWRQRPPTDKQIGAALKWRLLVNPDWNAGELSDALSAHIAAKKARGRNRPAWTNKK